MVDKPWDTTSAKADILARIAAVETRIITPFHFGAVGDGVADDSIPIQDMFSYVESEGRAIPMSLAGGYFYIGENAGTGLNLPTVNSLALQPCLSIDGEGATLWTDQPDIEIFRHIPLTAEQAGDFLRTRYSIRNITFVGTAEDQSVNQKGIHLAATYASRIENCTAVTLRDGFVFTWSLGCVFSNLLTVNCTRRSFVIQSSVGYDDNDEENPIWPGSSPAFTAGNANTFLRCRSFAGPTQTSAFGLFGVGGNKLDGCISEGHHAGWDVHYDFMGITSAKQLTIVDFHCETAEAKANFKVAAGGGVVLIDRVIRSYPQALLDMAGSQAPTVIVQNCPYWGDMPTPDPENLENPNGRWFYHVNGGGYGGVEAHAAEGATWIFRGNDVGNGIRDPAVWENDSLPTTMVAHLTQPLTAGPSIESSSNLAFIAGIGKPAANRIVDVEGSIRFPTADTYSISGAKRITTGSEGFRFADASFITSVRGIQVAVASDTVINNAATADIDFTIGGASLDSNKATISCMAVGQTLADKLAGVSVIFTIIGIHTIRMHVCNKSGGSITLTTGSAFNLRVVHHANVEGPY